MSRPREAPPSSLFGVAVRGTQDRATPIESLLGHLNRFESRNAPRALYLAGDATLLQDGRRISVVGSRRASVEDLALARSVTEYLVQAGISVVSGLADGIDTVAHKTAIELRGKTVAVLGTPLSRAYPASNAPLQHTIATEHLVVSQFPESSSVQRRNFAMRNRTMAILSDATVIVAASPTSGTKHQGWEAINLERPLAILEPLASSGIDWVEDQIRYGAEPLRLEDVAKWCESVEERVIFDEPLL